MKTKIQSNAIFSQRTLHPPTGITFSAHFASCVVSFNSMISTSCPFFKNWRMYYSKQHYSRPDLFVTWKYQRNCHWLRVIPVVFGCSYTISDNYRQRTTAAQLLLLKLHGLVYVYVVEEIKLNTPGSISGTIFAIFKKYAVRPVCSESYYHPSFTWFYSMMTLILKKVHKVQLLSISLGILIIRQHIFSHYTLSFDRSHDTNSTQK